MIVIVMGQACLPGTTVLGHHSNAPPEQGDDKINVGDLIGGEIREKCQALRVGS